MSSTQDKGEEKTLIDMPFHWKESGLNRATKNIRFVSDGEGGIWAYPSVLVGANPDNTEVRVNDIGKVNVDTVLTNQVGILVRSANYLYKPGVTDYFERLRTPTTFKFISDQTGSGVVWTPAGGKKYRLMGGIITLSKEAACAGMLNILLTDTGGNFAAFQVSHAALVATGNVVVIPFSFPGNGYLSPTADNTLTISLNGALTAGSWSCSVWGTEE